MSVRVFKTFFFISDAGFIIYYYLYLGCKGSNYLLISKDYSSSIAYFFLFLFDFMLSVICKSDFRQFWVAYF